MPSIVSGDKVAFLEPQEQIWKGESGRSFTLGELSGTDHLSPFDGIAGFTRGTTCYAKTLFRFPLRNAASGLSTNEYNIGKVNELINALRSEAKLLLLFLRSIHTIEVYNIDQQGRHTLSFQVKVTNSCVSKLKQQRAAFLAALSSEHGLRGYNFTRVIEFTAKFDVSVYDANTGSSSTSHWLVANRVDPSNATVRQASVQQKVFPWVGTALDLDNPGDGRIFCFLPMPIETASNLPIHVNGTFGLNDDRRSLKWPGVERKNDPTANWNELLVKYVIPACYSGLLLEAKSSLTPSKFYSAWPSVKSLSSQWDSLQCPVFSTLLNHPVVWSESSKQWVMPNQAVYLPKNKCGLVVENALTRCGVKLADVPPHVRTAFACVRMTITEVTPKLTRDKLRAHSSSYVSVDAIGKHVLLQYCTKDGRYSELNNLQLLPLASGRFEAFSTSRVAVYLCTQECPKYLLPNFEDRLVDIQQNADLHSTLRAVARARCSQLNELTTPGVASLLKECVPNGWLYLKSVSFPNSSNFPSSWFKLFWEWVRNKQLKPFANSFILPVRSSSGQSPGHFNVVKLNTQPLLFGSSCSSEILSILDKFQIFCCVQTEFSYVSHRELKKLNSFDAVGIMTAISQCPGYHSISLTTQEAASLRNLLAGSVCKIQSTYYHVLRKLKIFTVNPNAPNQLCSIEDVERSSLLRTPLSVSAPHGGFSLSVLPSNIVFFSADDYYQNQLLRVLGVTSLNTSSFLKTHTFPLITNRSISDVHIDSIMLEVLKKFDSLKVEDRSIVSVIGNLLFVKTSSGARQCPAKLFDPGNEDMNAIFAGSSVFPSPPYTQPESMTVLRSCGLRTSITAQEVLDTICSLTQGAYYNTTTPRQVDATTFSRANAILKYVGRSGFYHQNQRTQCTLQGIYGYHYFPAALSNLSSSRSWIPVCSERPSCYPKQLPWKGEGFTSHLCMLNSAVSVSSTSKPSHAVLYGSQVYFTEPVIECDVLTSEESPSHLVAHLQVLTSHVDSFTPDAMIEMLHKLYSAMSRSPISALTGLSSVDKWVYIRSCHKFVGPDVVALEHNPGFRQSLEPYLHKLPDSISSYSSLFTSFGVNNVLSHDQIISILASMREDISNNTMSISADECWSIVTSILNWLTENGTKDYTGSLDDIYVPVTSDSEWPDLQPSSDVTYTDNELLKRFSASESDKPLKFIHSRVGVQIAQCLQLTPLSQELDIAGDTFEDTGQYEPLTTRLKNILRDYKDGLTIVKEMMQNADDAEATEVNICYDARTHSQEKDKLFFPGMIDSHGPALVVHNNKVFSDEDFENITKLAGATKQNKHLKIGKFGIGFCSVYHVTDIPSFLSRDRLYIFDPTLEHLGKEIKNPALPGKKLKFKTRIIQNSKQLDPYENLFGFNGRESYDGTMFRLPFRKSPSELSGKCYTENTAMELLEDIYHCSESLVLFLQHVQTISFQRINNGETNPTTLFTVSKSKISLPHYLTFDSTVALAVESKKGSEQKSSQWLVSSHVTKNHDKAAVANIACKLSREGDSDVYSLDRSLNGEIFCYLPLAQSTGLPVHVSCNFAVINNRRGIWTADESTSTSEDEVEWNNYLMDSVIPTAYSSLLCCLKTMLQCDVLTSYKFYELWPLTSELKQRNPWSKFVLKLYDELTTSPLFFSESSGEWLSLKNSKFVEPNILDKAGTPSCVFEVLHHCSVPIIDLPVQYRAQLQLGDSVISQLGFINLFFANLSRLNNLCSSRNLTIQHMLELYIIESDHYAYSETGRVLQQSLTSHVCIPCSPDGSKLRRLTKLIHPSAPFAKLYDAEEAMFPLGDLVNRNLPDSAMKKLGIIVDKIPWEYVAERAEAVKALVSSNPNKGYNQIKLIIEAITSHTEGDPPSSADIKSIEFLPVLKKPSDFPLDWPGDGMTLSCGMKMARAGQRPKMPHVSMAGSQEVFLCEAKPQDNGCSHISVRAGLVLGLSSEPALSSVLAHFSLVIQEADNISQEWVSTACNLIYEYLDNLSSSEKLAKHFEGVPYIWTGKKFILDSQVSFKWNTNGPYLYPVPSVLRNKSSLCKNLGIKQRFSLDNVRQAMTAMKNDFQNKPIDRESQDIFNQLIPLLHDMEFSDDSLFVPDEKFILHAAKDLAYNDVPWAKQDDSYIYVHKIIPRDLARKIGVKPVRSKFLDKYSSDSDFHSGVAFGQREELTRRIQNILRDYPLDVTLLKELLQNADDAKATKMHIILDKRTHGTQSVLSENWQDLQGPALLVWNNSVFSEEDLKGIQQLGLGSKRSESETIGQYGIGFNVVYHITDCPSFVTNGDTLCILDPHCRYVPGADMLKPGRRFDRLKDGFWEDFPNLKSAYLRDDTHNVPQDLLGGSLFRFPIRHSKRKIKFSKITEDPNSVLDADKLAKDLRGWMSRMKEAMLFLNNISELKLLVIDENNRMETIFHYQSKTETGELSSKDNSTSLRGALSTFKSNKECRPHVITYPLTLTEVNKDGQGKDTEEKWLIQQGVGDINNNTQIWQYVDTVKPRHGIAAPLSNVSTKGFQGQVFCFLPLPVYSKFPVHVNGHFILNSTRRNLWTSTDSSRVDDCATWNNNLIQALSSSYADFLLKARHHYVRDEYENIRTALSCIEQYYSLFPVFPSQSERDGNMWQTLARDTYRCMLQHNHPVLCVLKSTPKGFTTEWHSLKSSSPADHVYYWAPFHYYTDGHKKIYPILERIGMKITPASKEVMNCFNTVLKDSKLQGSPFAAVTSQSIFDYYTKSSCLSVACGMKQTPVEDTAFNDVASFVLFTEYILLNEPTQSVYSPYAVSVSDTSKFKIYPSPPYSHYLLLTADGMLRRFEKDAKCLSSSFSRLFPNSLSHFLHPELLGVTYTRSYFIQSGDSDTTRIANIMLQLMKDNLPGELRSSVIANATTVISEELLKSLWNCFDKDSVFNNYIPNIIQCWALLLSEDNRLFSSSSNIIPVHHVYSTTIEDMCRVVKKVNMPILNRNVVTANSNCPRFTDGKRILSILYHINSATPILPLLTEQDLDVIIDYLKCHLKPQDYDADTTTHLKSLPLFENIDGSYTAISHVNAYIWPSDACSVAYQKWLDGHNAVFMKRSARWSRLRLSVAKIFTENLYISYIFPHFNKMNSKDRYEHLKYIRDVLYQSYKVNSERTFGHYSKIPQELYDSKQRGTSFISHLKDLYCIDNNGPLRRIRAFCDHTVDIFNAFPDHRDFLFLPEDYKADKMWLPFFRELGMQTSVTKDEFIMLCQETACGTVDTKKRSEVLLRNLLVLQQEWQSDEHFFNRVSEISFLQQEPTPCLAWLVPNVCPVQQLVKLRDSALVSHASLVWTVRPVIKLPECSKPSLVDQLGVITNPSAVDVIKNIENICKKSSYAKPSLFSNYPETLTCPKDHFTLLHILSRCFSHLSQTTSGLSKLQTLPCVPVYHSTDASQKSDKKMVLVKPNCVMHGYAYKVKKFHPFLHSLPEDLRLVAGLLQSIGVKDKLELSHIQVTLESAFKAAEENELEMNTHEVIKLALKSLYDLCKDCGDTDQLESIAAALDPLYLPDSDNVLRKSKSLVYGDTLSYVGEIALDLNDVPYYHFSTLEHSYEPCARDICHVLPKSVRPIGLSEVCKQVVLEGTERSEHSEMALKLMETQELPDISEGIVCLVDSIVKKQENDEQLKEVVCSFLNKLEVVTVTNLCLKIVFNQTGQCIGTAKKKFCYVPVSEGDGGSVLYLDSEIRASSFHADFVYSEVATYLCAVLLKNIEVDHDQRGKIHSAIQSCLKATTGQDIKSMLLDFGIRLYGARMQRFAKKLGEEVPECWHHRIDQDIDNVFNPMEYVGYEDRDGHIIVAQIVHPIEPKKGEQVLEKRFKIYVSEDDKQGKDVSILSLYKFLIGKKQPKVQPMTAEEEENALTPYDADDNIANYRASLLAEGLTEVKKKICSQLREIWKLSHEPRRKALKRMFLKWHPDKNPNNPLEAEKIFKFMMKQIEHLEKGEPLDDPAIDEEATAGNFSYSSGGGGSRRYSRRRNWRSSSRYYNDFNQWDNMAGRHSASYSHEHENRGGGGGWGGGGGGGGGGFGGGGGASSRSGASGGTSFPFDETEDEKNPEEGERWVKQAEAEFAVLSCLHSQAAACSGYFYVCFMAHQVVERALKGAVCALCGMDGRNLDDVSDSNLGRNARALEAVQPERTEGLVHHVIPLEDYYLNTRYPNKWEGYTDIPAEHYAQDDADQAKEHAQAVLAIVRAIMPAINED